MKNLYLKSYLIMVLLFVIQVGYAQNVLNESPNGAKIQSYLDQNKGDYNLLELDVQDLYVTNEFYSKSSEITHVYVNQRYEGIKIHNAISSVAIKDGAVFYYATNGTLVKSYIYVNDVLHGYSKHFNSKGDLLIEGAYKNDKKHGVWKFYENGKLVKTQDFTTYSKNPFNKSKKN